MINRHNNNNTTKIKISYHDAYNIKDDNNELEWWQNNKIILQV